LPIAPEKSPKLSAESCDNKDNHSNAEAANITIAATSHRTDLRFSIVCLPKLANHCLLILFGKIDPASRKRLLKQAISA